MAKRWRYFADSEVQGLDAEFVALMDNARHISGIPWVITNGKRTPGDTASGDPNAVENSAHYAGLAADIRCRTSHEVWAILKGCFAVGINRIGIYLKQDAANPLKLVPTHMHIDTDKSKLPEVVWHTKEA